MEENDWFLTKLSRLKDDYIRRDKSNREELARSYELRWEDKAKHDLLVRDLLRALERAQEVIVMLGEQSGNEKLLKEARVYANAIGGVVGEFTHYADNSIVEKHWE